MAPTEQALINYIAEHPGAGREEIRRHVAPDMSAPTIWRMLKKLADNGYLEIAGKARATSYYLAGAAAVHAYLQSPYTHRKPTFYNKEFLDHYIPGKTFYLSAADRDQLRASGQPQSPAPPAGTYARRILEQLLVDLSWASSRMEGNTYDILQTERLIRFGEEAAGKDRKEALMILNHKEAIQYVADNLNDISINRPDIFSIHALLADGLLTDPAMAGRLRRMPVGISYSSYKPLDDMLTIEEEFDIILEKAGAITDPFEQSFFLLVHIPYLQAFVDINKRTSRVAANIPLLKADLAPMSFMTMNDHNYINGLIGIYELNNVSLLREVYIDAYLSSAQNYHILIAEVENPSKAALVYRDFVRNSVRRCVLEWKSFQPDNVMAIAIEEGIPEEDRAQVVAYIKEQFYGLHEGNIIRYRLRPEDLNEIKEAPDSKPT